MNTTILHSQFKPETDIHAFLTGEKYRPYRDFNRHVYEGLAYFKSEDGLEGYFFEPLHFFNFFYEQVAFITENHDRPLDVVNYLRSLDLLDVERFILYFFLNNFRGHASYDPNEGGFWELTSFCYSFIQQEFESFISKIPGPPLEYKFTFEFTRSVLNLIPMEYQVAYLIDGIGFSKQLRLERPDVFSEEDLKTYVTQCEVEIERIERLQSKAAPAPAPEEIKLTQATVALFYYYRQTAGEFPLFDTMVGGKKKAMYEEAAKYKLSKNKFYTTYNKLQFDVNRLNPVQKKHIKAAIAMLQEYPKAVALAEIDLRKIE